ncbi:hypothetical protein [Hymenobacter actinosclerus]|uniref:Dolichyl-phosphate-mannose-protein mannosyltransferase n=1 Tax=Hymenobacter actinosclerus TaxID=82805 RepID=A0A1I0GYS7_9BACT|nr:hypothetical protein [Hymenobacter actinosclerus]SET75507.1 hypothetical protein SAMN04487998_2623 [Hymenobacter actinosclerus]
MDLKDLFLTPFYLALFYGLAFAVRKRFTNALTKKYFIPALSVKFLGAISLGLIYQFYYGGGDTFNYYTHVKIVYQAFSDSPALGLKLIFGPAVYDPLTIKYTGQMYWYDSATEYFVVRVAAFFALLCFNTYSIIGLFFAALSFSGMWAMYLTFLRIYPLAYKKLAIAVFFLPSVFFWGSGLLKDSLCMGALGWVFYGFYHALIERKSIPTALTLGGIGIYVLISVKVYILLSFMPPALLWVFNENNQRIKSASVRLFLKPLFLLVGLGSAYFGATNLTAGDERFDVDKIGERTKITQEYLSTYVSSGSSYNIGQLDGSIGSIVKVAPQAIIVSLYRPFLFEANNPVMLLSALEATLFIYLTISLFYRTGISKGLRLIAARPILLFSFLFCLIFAVGVGVNSGNFGTLVRYKIPLMPFYLAALYIMQSMAQTRSRPKTGTTVQLNKARKFGSLATTE